MRHIPTMGQMLWLMLLTTTSSTASASGSDECRGNQNCDDIEVDAYGGTADADADSESYSDSSAVAGSESISGAEASADNNVAVNFTSPRSTTVRNVASPDTPNVYPSAPCRIARSAGLSLAGGSLSGGASVEDVECTLRETARTFQALGVPEVGLHLMCTNSHVINGRYNKKGNLPKGSPTPIGAAECLRLVREFQGDSDDNDIVGAVRTEVEVIREQHDRAERELLARVEQLEVEASKPRSGGEQVVRQETIHQPLLNDEKRAKLAALFSDDEEKTE